MHSFIALPEDKSSLQREIRFNMSYCQANKLSQTAKWLGELLVTVQVPQKKATQGQRKTMAATTTRQGNNIISTDDQVMSGSENAQ
jgi:hypothetical protein